MHNDRTTLPHETNRRFLTDGGTETWLIHKRGLDLPYFSSFHLLDDSASELAEFNLRALALYRDVAGEVGLHARFPHLNVFGGCCGTDSSHVRKISSALQGASSR